MEHVTEGVISRGDDPRTSCGCTPSPTPTPTPPPFTRPTPVPPQSLGGFGEDIKRRLDERECGRWEGNGWGDGQSGSAQMWGGC